MVSVLEYHVVLAGGTMGAPPHTRVYQATQHSSSGLIRDTTEVRDDGYMYVPQTPGLGER